MLWFYLFQRLSFNSLYNIRIFKLVTIITGEINSGKTKKMKSLYSESKSGDGFLCNKIFKNSIHIGYDLVSISNKNIYPFIREKQYLKASDKTLFKTGKYYFLEKAFQSAEKKLVTLMQEKISPIYIDELGPLELQKKGFYRSVVNISKQDLPLIICVRKSCLQDIIELFNFTKYQIIEVQMEVPECMI